MRTIGLVAVLCVFSVAVGEGEAGKKKKATVPKGYVETLLGPGEWVVGNDQGEEMTLRSVNQRTIAKAKVANLEWTFKDMENSMASPPALIAVTKKGIHLLNSYEAGVDDKKLAKLLKKRKPELKLPLKVGAKKKGSDVQYFVEVRDGNVCVGFNLLDMCGGMGCDAEMCLGSMGLVSVSGAYSPDEMQWNWIAGSLTIPEPAAADPGEQAITEITALRDRACACKDKKCGDAVMADLDTWSAANASTQATQAQLETLEQLGTALGTCIGKLR